MRASLGLAGAPAWERGRLGLLPASSLLILGVAAAQLSLVALAPLAARFRWSMGSAAVLNATVGLLLVSAVWGELSEGTFWRWFGVFAVLLAANTIAVPVLQRPGRIEASVAELAPSAGLNKIRFCPWCGAAVSEEPGGIEISCDRCSSQFRVEYLNRPGVAGDAGPGAPGD